MTKKLDTKKILEKVRASIKDPKEREAVTLGSALTADRFLEMPEFWQKATNTPGLPLNKIVMLAGDSDSGKTSAAIQAMKAAQDQGFAVIYIDTEKKTRTEDLVCWGVDPDEVFVVKNTIAEEAFNLMFKAWDAILAAAPDTKLLVIIDSIGNVVSQRDAELDMSRDSQKPGGKGTINRLMLSKLVAKMAEGEVAVLLINYTYDNIGSPGKTNAGGKSLNFFASLTYQTARKRWLEGTEKGEKVRRGARVRWTLYKNHISKSEPGPKFITFDITADGMKYLENDND